MKVQSPMPMLPAKRRTRFVFLVLFFALAILLIQIGQHRRQQAAGICASTGQRLTDQEILRLGKAYAIFLGDAYGARGFSEQDFRVRVVADAELRAEERPPGWVLFKGGYRAYVEISFDETAMAGYGAMGLQPVNLVVISNCGKIRTAIYEY